MEEEDDDGDEYEDEEVGMLMQVLFVQRFVRMSLLLQDDGDEPNDDDSEEANDDAEQFEEHGEVRRLASWLRHVLLNKSLYSAAETPIS